MRLFALRPIALLVSVPVRDDAVRRPNLEVHGYVAVAVEIDRNVSVNPRSLRGE